MLTKRIIPCLDIRDGRVVKGVRFSGLRDAGDPVEQSVRYEEQGADEIVILDVSATSEGRGTAADTVGAVRNSVAIPLTVGGGVRCVADAERLLSVGADKVAVNTAAVEKPEILSALAERTGSQCVVLALDAAQRIGQPGWEVVTRSGSCRTGMDALEWAERAEAMGVGEVLLTSWDRDGTGEGFDLDLLTAMSARVRVPIIASGGASGAEDLFAAIESGADAVLAASIFHYGSATVQDVKARLAARGVEVRQ